jgi:hypothetical protein
MAHVAALTTIHFLCTHQDHTKLKMLVKEKHSSLIGSFISYEKNEVL